MYKRYINSIIIIIIINGQYSVAGSIKGLI